MTHKEMLIFGLMIKCPVNGEQLPGCPLHEYRDLLSLEQKFEFTCKLDSQMVEEIIAIHNECFHKREKVEVRSKYNIIDCLTA